MREKREAKEVPSSLRSTRTDGRAPPLSGCVSRHANQYDKDDSLRDRETSGIDRAYQRTVPPCGGALAFVAEYLESARKERSSSNSRARSARAFAL